jgi:epsilon-lactone hydrolase
LKAANEFGVDDPVRSGRSRAAIRSAGVLIAAATLFAHRVSVSAEHRSLEAAPKAVAGLMDADGVVHLPPMAVPFSTFASPAAKAEFLQGQQYAAAMSGRGPVSIEEERKAVTDYFQPALALVKSMYPIATTHGVIGGVPVDAFTPKEGVLPRNAHRVLIDLHGGGFKVGAGIVSALESIPVASLGRIRVVSVNYRQGPEYRYPAATRDVITVYRELLKTYSARSIGIYGCSAGGLLTAEVVAALVKEELPVPGAIGIFCASAAGWTGGDSGSTALPLSGFALSADVSSPPHPQVSNALYFAAANLEDPLVLPIRSDTLLSKFPPTLFITSTRDAAMSGAVYTHAQLTRLGVEADLHVWEGLGHSFFANDPGLRESREALDVITKFFDKRLNRNW